MQRRAFSPSYHPHSCGFRHKLRVVHCLPSLYRYQSQPQICNISIRYRPLCLKFQGHSKEDQTQYKSSRFYSFTSKSLKKHYFSFLLHWNTYHLSTHAFWCHCSWWGHWLSWRMGLQPKCFLISWLTNLAGPLNAEPLAVAWLLSCLQCWTEPQGLEKSNCVWVDAYQ